MRKHFPLIREFVHRADMYLFALCCICTIFGMIIISSATASYENSYRYLIIQGIAFLIGIGLFVLFTVIDIDVFADNWLRGQHCVHPHPHPLRRRR